MEKQNKPIIVNAEPGTYYWCSCGKSSQFPKCDGSHASTDFKPYVATLTDKATIAICACGKSGNSPYCDGSHKNVEIT